MGSIGSLYLVSSVMFGIIFLIFGSLDNSYAVDFVLSEDASCTGLPGGGGTWDNPTLTCTMTTSLSIILGDTLTIPQGVTLEFDGNIRLANRGNIENHGTIILQGTNGNGGQLRNSDTGTFTNTGVITIEGLNDDSGRLWNRNDATFTNSGTITITGSSELSGWLRNVDTSDFTNAGTITILGTDINSGQLRNLNSATLVNSGSITLIGTNDDSGLVRNLSVLTNSGSMSTNYNFDNSDSDSALTNSGFIEITLELDNSGGFIFNDCSEIVFGSFTGNPIQEEDYCPISLNSGSYEDPTIGKSNDGRQMVENGICIDIKCWTVTADFYQEFKLVEMLSDSTHTISATVFCQSGVNKCNYVAFGVSPYGTNINDSVWKVILQKDHLDNWTMTVVDTDGYLGEVTSTTQIVDNRHLQASATIEFKKPTPGMILNVEVRDSNGGYRDFKFNDGVSIVDAYAYPSVETAYEDPIETKPLCLNENSNKRYTCAFDMVRDWTIKNAESALEEITK